MRHPYTRQLLQELDTEIITKILKTDQNDIAAMARVDPLGDDRSNVVYIVIMTKKEEGSHTLTPKGLKVGNLSIIAEYSGAGLRDKNVRNFTPGDTQLPCYSMPCSPISKCHVQNQSFQLLAENRR